MGARQAYLVRQYFNFRHPTQPTPDRGDGRPTYWRHLSIERLLATLALQLSTSTPTFTPPDDPGQRPESPVRHPEQLFSQGTTLQMSSGGSGASCSIWLEIRMTRVPGTGLYPVFGRAWTYLR